MKKRNERPLGRPRTSDQTMPTEEIIIQTASRLFLENGYPTISVDDVAKACNVTKATIYYYYASKAELFTEAMVKMMIRIRKKMNSMLQENLPLKKRLLNITKTHLKATTNVDTNGLTKGLNNALSPEQQQKIHQAETDMYQALEHAFIDAMERVEIRSVQPIFTVHAYLSLLKIGNLDNQEEKFFSDTDKMAEQIVDLLWNGISPNDEMEDK
ncbi:TetR/AcrR family transcriptional regulator [Virgibacillus siamensis]|uniref:TetR/AcrR family transcriptional regulator n=1 Tax=Virgibacillus siamensis TaxID=480071 RepID=UPI0009870044|nr:TetR/AcrR family transcriptional regulator [Virgibacillus siamensis]